MSIDNEAAYLTKLRSFAALYGGVLLSTTCNHSREDLLWKCLFEHTFRRTPNSVLSGNWCSECISVERRSSPDEIRVFIAAKGGNAPFLEEEYKNMKKHITWECKFLHRWRASWANVKFKGRWCPICAKNKKLTIDDARKAAMMRGGICLSEFYKNNHTALLFRCIHEHIFKQTMNGINSRNLWCPTCSGWTSESICRIYFETLFANKFPSIRPQWLMGEKGHPLELDGYCAELNFAFEHQGLQHYAPQTGLVDIFSQEIVEEIQRRDALKQKLCKINDVPLIIIPQLFRITSLKNLKSLIKLQCINLNITIPPKFDIIEPNISSVYDQTNNRKLGRRF